MPDAEGTSGSPSDVASLQLALSRLRDQLAVIAGARPTPQELADDHAADVATARRIHQARPGVPVHHVLAVLEVLRAMGEMEPAAPSASEPPVVGTARIHLDVATTTTANLPEFERAQAVARAEEAEAAIRRVRDASAYIRTTTRTWDPVADIIDAALDEGGDPVHARVAAAVRTVLNQDLPGDMGGHVATAVLAVLREERPDA
ncbi:hypothetical protein [Streptomyces cyaneofuscatus]|uniref:hypothetical protein n=1 Tax=Streptomyces cyaneofuscatus TaxID=66883 RepID=UPI0036D83004